MTDEVQIKVIGTHSEMEFCLKEEFEVVIEDEVKLVFFPMGDLFEKFLQFIKENHLSDPRIVADYSFVICINVYWEERAAVIEVFREHELFHDKFAMEIM